MPEQIEAVMDDAEFQQFTHRIFDLLDTRIAKLYHFATIQAYNVVMLLVAV